MDNRRSRNTILILMALAVLIVVAGAAGLLAYSWQAVDGLELRRETLLVRRVLDRSLARTESELKTATIWDDAFVHTQGGMDLTWVDTNFSDYFSKYFGHDVTLVFDAAARPALLAMGGRRTDPGAMAALERDLTPIVKRVQARERIRRYDPDGQRRLGFDDLVTEKGVIQVGDQFFLLAVSTVAPDTPAAASKADPKAPAVVVVSGRRLDHGFLASIKQDMGIDGGKILAQRPAAGPSVPLKDFNGHIIGHMAWSAEQPGIQVLTRAGGFVATGAVVLLLAAFALVLKLKGLFLRLQMNDRALGEAMDELVRAKDRAEAANVAKSQFLANMSHEIRTPLNGVLGMAQAMALDDLSPAQHERLAVIRDSGESLLHVLNDVLDISKIEAGKLELSVAPFDLEETVRAAAATFAGVARGKGLELKVMVAPAARGGWIGDAERIRQVLANLVSNSVKFTDHGAVTVRADVADGALVLSVTDTGIGISQAAQSQLFAKFAQVDGSATRRYGGTGLGLAICRELVGMMGGEIEMSSVLGEGACFRMTLPLERARRATAAAGAPAAAPSAPPEGLKILAAEDNETNRRVLQALLAPIGASIVFARNGREAVEAFGRGRFDVILMDIQMPEMNGVDACRLIRTAERERGVAPTPMLALSANVLIHQTQQYRAAGMDDCIAKPVQADRLYAAIAAAMEKAAQVRQVA